jgi:hypothetical protein
MILEYVYANCNTVQELGEPQSQQCIYENFIKLFKCRF